MNDKDLTNTSLLRRSVAVSAPPVASRVAPSILAASAASPASPARRLGAPARSSTALALAALVSVTCVGCQMDFSESDGGEADGALGNGTFYFDCADAVTCKRFGSEREVFPSAVSLGSTFQVRYEARPRAAGVRIAYDDTAPERGLTVASVGEGISVGAHGFLALGEGLSSLVARDASGKVVDFVAVRVARPDDLVVYSVLETGPDPTAVDTIALEATSRASYRAFARSGDELLAGALAVQWRSSDPTVFVVDHVRDGTATIVARGSGIASLVATGGTFVREISVMVTP